MEIRIGLENSARELSFETNQTAEEVEQIIRSANDEGVARFTDDRDRVFLVNAAKITFIEIGAENQRRVGFVA